MKESGIGTPATRAATIELLLYREYIEREGRALHATEKGIQVIRLLGQHPLTSAELTGDWERRLGLIERGEDSRPAFMKDIAKFTTETVQELDKLKGVQIERAKLGPCAVCGREIVENRKGYSCWSREDPGCGFVIWKRKAGKSLPVSVAKELIESLRAVARARRGPRRGPHGQAGDRLQGPLGAPVPRQAQARAGRRGQVAGRLRRGVGHLAAGAAAGGGLRRRRSRRVLPRQRRSEALERQQRRSSPRPEPAPAPARRRSTSGARGSPGRSSSRRPTPTRRLPWAGMPPASLSIRARCSRFQVMKWVLRLVKSFSWPPEPASR